MELDQTHLLLAVTRIEDVVRRRLGEILDPSLAGGLAGALTFLASVDSVRARNDYDTYIELLEDDLASRAGGASLHNGWLGSYWATCRIIQLRDRCSYSEAASQVSVDISELEDAAEYAEDFDLADGLTGIAAALRQADPCTRAQVGRVITQKLEQMATYDSMDRARWATPPRRMRPGQHAPYFDLGLYHGNVGVMVASAWLQDDLGYPLRMGGVAEWLLSICEDNLTIPAFVGGQATRTAWCYGHPGVGCAMLRTAVSRDQSALSEYAIRASAHVARTSTPSASYQPFWCHGSAGLAYMFWSLSRATGERIFSNAHNNWTSHMLAQINTLEDADWPCGLGLVDGLAGIGMCLLTIMGKIDTTWESVMGLDFSWVAGAKQ